MAESFMTFTSVAIDDHIILYYFLQQDFAKWLDMTWNHIQGKDISVEIKNK